MGLSLRGVALALCLTVTSCQSVSLYAKRRVHDFSDCFALAIAPGTADPTSLALGIEITEYVPLGLGWSRGTEYGLVNGHFGPQTFALCNFSVIVYATELILSVLFDELHVEHDSVIESDHQKSMVVQHARSKPRGRNPDRSFRVGAHAGFSVFFVYADVELGELLDFALGIFGIDIMNDDVPADEAADDPNDETDLDHH